jgi:hypothetical protein
VRVAAIVQGVIRIRTGRSWRHHPANASELRALTAPAARDYRGERLLDVIGIEIDGVDVAAGIGEAPVVEALDELAAAILRVGQGEPAAQATVGPGPTELVLEPRGADVQLSLVTLWRPARVLAQGLLVDGARLRAAALAAAQALLMDLLELGPALEGAPLVKRLSRSCAALARAGRRSAPEWPPRSVQQPGFVAKGGRAPLSCEVQVPAAAAARLAARALCPWSPLAPLLGPGAVSLRFGKQPALRAEGPPWLLLRELLAQAGELVHAWEAGEPACTLHLGAHELRCDLSTDELRAAGWKHAVKAPPARVAEAIAQAAKGFAARALALGPGSAVGTEEPLAELAAAAAELLGHCKDLRSGALHRAPEAVRAPPSRSAPARSPASELPGRLRRLRYQTAAQVEVGPLLPGGLHALHHLHAPQQGHGAPGASLLLQGAAGLQCLDAGTGARLWHLAGAGTHPGSVCVSGAGDLFVTHEDALLRLDPATSATRWKRVTKLGAHALASAPGGCARALETGVAFIRDAGTLAFRGKLPEQPQQLLAVEGGLLLAALPSSLLVAFELPAGGEVWRRRLGVRVGPVRAAGPLLVCVRQDLRTARALCAVDAATGELRWERPLPPGGPEHPGPVTLTAEHAWTLAGPGVCGVDLATGGLRFQARLPWGPSGELLALEEAGHPSALLAAGPGGALQRLDARGAPVWAHPAEGTLPPLPPQHAGPVLLSAGAGAAVLDAATGALLARPVAAEVQVDGAALLPDLSLALHLGAGALLSLRLALHLSVV